MFCPSTAYKLAKCCSATLIKDSEGIHDLKTVERTIRSEFADLKFAVDLQLFDFEALFLRFNLYTAIAFRHSDEESDWVTNRDFLPQEGMHRGYLKAANSLHPHIRELVQDTPFYLAGHSLGGAIAIALSSRLKDLPGWKGTYAYGPPKIVLPSHLTSFNIALKEKLFVFRKARDIVPSLPPVYKHAASTFYIDKKNNIIPDYTPRLRELLDVNWRDLYEGHHIRNYIEAFDQRRKMTEPPRCEDCDDTGRIFIEDETYIVQGSGIYEEIRSQPIYEICHCQKDETD